MKQLKLSNGYTIPEIGYGTWRTPDDETCIEGVRIALTNGYTHIDAAAIYGNEISVGKGIALAGVDRSQYFLTSKVWNSERGYDKTIAAFHKTIKDLGVDYLDLYLIHWPANAVQFENYKQLNADTWRALEDLYEQGLVKSIGVSNFMLHNIKDLEESARIQPMVNQIEFHPGYMQSELVAYCQAKGIVVEAWSPLANGDVFKSENLQTIATKYNKNIAQIVLRWVLQHNVLPLTKSVTESRIVSNIDIYDFSLTSDEMQIIDQEPACGACTNPDSVTF